MVEYEKWDKNKEARFARRFWLIVAIALALLMGLMQWFW